MHGPRPEPSIDRDQPHCSAKELPGQWQGGLAANVSPRSNFEEGRASRGTGPRSTVWGRMEVVDRVPPDVMEGGLLPHPQGPGRVNQYLRDYEDGSFARPYDSADDVERRNLPYSQGPAQPPYEDPYQQFGPADDLEKWRLSYSQGPARQDEVRQPYETADDLERRLRPYSQGPARYEEGRRTHETAADLERRRMPYSQGPARYGDGWGGAADVSERGRVPHSRGPVSPHPDTMRGYHCSEPSTSRGGRSYMTAQVRCLTFLDGPSDGVERWRRPYPRGPDAPGPSGEPWSAYEHY